MAKKSGSIVYKCSNCGYSQPRWLGRCPECGEWNSLEEIIIDKNNVTPAGRGSQAVEKQKPVGLASVKAQEKSRLSTGIDEFDRVLGGGATKRSAILLGGEPGIGKSTLLLQTAASVAASGAQVLYISGEESAAQIKERADRLELSCKGISILCTSRLEDSLDYSVYKAGSREAALRDFAETTDCRRQVLLDALGAEQAVCSGCDLCDARKKEAATGKKVKPALSDWQLAYNIIKRSRNYYSEDEIESELFEKLNARTRHILGLNIWTHKDTVDVVRQLKDSGRVELDNFLWKGRLRIKRK